MYNQTITAIMENLEKKCSREKVHSENVGLISCFIGEIMNLDYETLKEIKISGCLHDIGKVAISESLLNKAGKLTDLEYEEIQRHPEIGYHILKTIDSNINLADHVLCHHERWDGKGYPRGLMGEEIPLISRIIAISDAFEVMTGDRPYRKPLSKNEAIKELKRCSGSQFDPNIIELFTRYALMNGFESKLIYKVFR